MAVDMPLLFKVWFHKIRWVTEYLNTEQKYRKLKYTVLTLNKF